MRTLLRWTGDDPDREGLLDTPKRVAKAYREMFSGYDMDPAEELGRTFEEVAGYDDIVSSRTSRSIRIASTTWCRSSARRMSPTCRTARSLGLSKIARVVDIFAHRLQTQEAMTAQIAAAIDETCCNPRGVAVMIEAEHMCMAMRGIRKQGSTTLTSTFTGALPEQPGRAGPLHDHGAGRPRRNATLPLLQTQGPAMSALVFPAAAADKMRWRKARLSRRASTRTAWSRPS